jgi:hypothetical protein
VISNGLLSNLFGIPQPTPLLVFYLLGHIDPLRPNNDDNHRRIYISRMATILRRQHRLSTRASLMPSGRYVVNPAVRRTYAESSSDANKQGQGCSPDSKPVQDNPNRPIPSNKAKPTLHDGRQSPMADMEGHLRDDLPEDVKQHNADVEHRHDRPYNHMSDQGKVEHPWKKEK